MSNGAAGVLIALCVAFLIVIARGLHNDDFDGENVFSWLKNHVFNWSYTPLKGSLYLRQILYLILGFLFVFAYEPVIAKSFATASGINAFLTPEARLIFFRMGVHSIFANFLFYLITRVSEHSYSVELTALALMQIFLQRQSLHFALRQVTEVSHSFFPRYLVSTIAMFGFILTWILEHRRALKAKKK